MKYVTLSELNSYLGTSGEDTLITTLWNYAESVFDTLIGQVLEEWHVTQYFPYWYSEGNYPEGRVFWLNSTRIIDIVTINGTDPGTKDTDYIIEWRRLELKNTVTTANTFPFRYTIVYNAGYNPIPDDVKLAVSILVGALYNTKNANGISSYRQDLLSVNYKDGNILESITDTAQKGVVQAIINKYTVHTFLT